MILLALGADSLKPAFCVTEMPSEWTPIHLAVHYNMPNVIELLWQKISSQTAPLCSVLSNTPFLRKFPIACALCTQTHAERLARHGRSYIHNLRKIIQLFPRDLLRQSS